MSKEQKQAESDLLAFFQVMVNLTKEQRIAVMDFLASHHAHVSKMAADAPEAGPTPGEGGGTGQ